MEKVKSYIAPECEEIEVKLEIGLLDISGGGSEKVVVSSHVYGDSDFD